MTVIRGTCSTPPTGPQQPGDEPHDAGDREALPETEGVEEVLAATVADASGDGSPPADGLPVSPELPPDDEVRCDRGQGHGEDEHEHASRDDAHEERAAESAGDGRQRPPEAAAVVDAFLVGVGDGAGGGVGEHER